MGIVFWLLLYLNQTLTIHVVVFVPISLPENVRVVEDRIMPIMRQRENGQRSGYKKTGSIGTAKPFT